MSETRAGMFACLLVCLFVCLFACLFARPLKAALPAPRGGRVPGQPAAPRALRQEAQAHPHRLLALAAAAAGTRLREEPLRGGGRAQAAGRRPQPVGDPGQLVLS